MRRDAVGLPEDLREAVRFIADDTSGFPFESFERDRLTRQFVERDVQVIGEGGRRPRHDGPATA